MRKNPSLTQSKFFGHTTRSYSFQAPEFPQQKDTAEDSERGRAQECYFCPCAQCKSSLRSLSEQKKPFPLENGIIFSNPDKEKDFNFVLSNLIPPPSIERSLRLMIPETVLFFKGEQKAVVYTGRVS